MAKTFDINQHKANCAAASKIGKAITVTAEHKSELNEMIVGLLSGKAPGEAKKKAKQRSKQLQALKDVLTGETKTTSEKELNQAVQLIDQLQVFFNRLNHNEKALVVIDKLMLTHFPGGLNAKQIDTYSQFYTSQTR